MSTHPVVIVGGGFAGVSTAKELLKRGVHVTLVSQTNHFTFTPLLHEVATGSLIAHDATFEYEGFFHDRKLRFVRERVVRIDRQAKEVVLEGGGRVVYAFLVVAVGSTTNRYDIKGAHNAFELKSIEDALALKRGILARAQDLKRHVSVTVVGGGPTGLELIFDIDRMLRALKRRARGSDYDLRLVHATDVFCRGGGERVQAYIARALKRAKIEVVCNAQALEIGESNVTTSAGVFHSDVTVLTAGVRPNTDAFAKDLALDARGHIPVHPSLQTIEDSHVFAVGDVIAIDGAPVPKLAQTAVRQAVIAARNIARLRQDKQAELVPYRPSVFGMLFSLGYGDGVGTIGPIIVKGAFAWYIWRTVYLFKTPGIWNKLRVAFSWTMDLFQGRNLTEL